MTVVQRKAMLKSEGFFPHKKNAIGTTIIYSRKHPTAKFMRVVIDSGIDSKTNKVVGKVGVKLCFVNRQKSWREVTTQIFTTNTGLASTARLRSLQQNQERWCVPMRVGRLGVVRKVPRVQRIKLHRKSQRKRQSQRSREIFREKRLHRK